jgi:hypothetical protein
MRANGLRIQLSRSETKGSGIFLSTTFSSVGPSGSFGLSGLSNQRDQPLTGSGHALLEVSLLYSGRTLVSLNHDTTLVSTRIAAPQ